MMFATLTSQISARVAREDDIAMRKFLLIFLGVVCLSLAQQAAPPPAFTNSFYLDWKAISIAVAALSVVASSMLIMVSRLFGLRNLEQVAKTEFVFAVSTVLIVMMAAGIIQLAEPLLGGPNSLASSLYGASLGLPRDAPLIISPQPETLIDWMKLYMETSATCVDGFMKILYALSIPIDAMASIYMDIFMSEQATGFGVKWISERIMNTTNSLTFYMYMYYLIAHILDFVKYYAGFFFSIGVALRAFPPTRGAGGYLMAVAFGLYFIFPLAYILIATLSLPHVQSNLVELEDSGAGGAGYHGTGYICATPQVPDTTQFGCGGADIGRTVEYQNFLHAHENLLTDVLTTQIDSLGRHLVSSICIFPMVAFTVMFTFVLNTTSLFGGNIPEIGRGLVKLI